MLKLSTAALAGAAFASKATETVRIEFTLFSAFYSPLVLTVAGRYLAEEGLSPVISVSSAGRSALASLDNGTADVVQTAPSQAFNDLEKGNRPTNVHFAQINQKDGFFLAARAPDPSFTWKRLEGKKVLVTPGVQPTTMFKYACFKAGIDISKVQMIEAGPPEAMLKAFASGTGDYVHLQGPMPQQLAHDGKAHIVTSLGDVIGLCAFSSLAAKREWLATPKAAAFARAYRKACGDLLSRPAAEIARIEQSYFEGVPLDVLETTITSYQQLGNWSSDIAISRPSFEATLDIFQHAGLIRQRYAYEDVVAAVPGA
ncbi:ABC transporter substrate-binding protein [Achromobacter sp. HZ28]|uniref:ABC transporter substrate-binding protein n=2 Tax=unclassified Achromobacter TaxID=2626865 RepID=UPI00130391E3|nr:ABC transporter substrate-binding protein [Achromobacter sp. HZ28]